MASASLHSFEPKVESGERVVEPLKILIAEDIEDNQFLFRGYFNTTPHSIEFANNGLIAFERYSEQQFDLVIMDIQMPVMDGYTAIRKIRNWEQTRGLPEVPIIAVTAHALTAEIKKARQAGCTAYLSKPIRKSVLLGAILKYAQKPSAVVSADEVK